MFEVEERDLAALSAEPEELRALAVGLGSCVGDGGSAEGADGLGHYVLVCGAGSAQCNGVYARIEREHNGAPVFVAPSGHSISRERIAGGAGFVLMKSWNSKDGCQVWYGTRQGDERLPYREEWKAYKGSEPCMTVFPLTQNILRVCGHADVELEDSSERHSKAWLWIQGSCLFVSRSIDDRSLIACFDMNSMTVDPGTDLLQAYLSDKVTGEPLATIAFSSPDDKIYWITTLQVISACFPSQSQGDAKARMDQLPDGYQIRSDGQDQDEEEKETDSEQEQEHEHEHEHEQKQEKGKSDDTREKTETKPRRAEKMDAKAKFEPDKETMVSHFKELKKAKKKQEREAREKEERRLGRMTEEERAEYLEEKRRKEEHEQKKDYMLKAQIKQFAKPKIKKPK